MKTKSPTNALTAVCLDWLALHGVMAWRQNTTGVYDPVHKVFRSFAGRKGVSDILGVIPPRGRFLAVEVKTGSDRISEHQRAFLDSVNAKGGLGLVVRTLADLEAGMREVKP